MAALDAPTLHSVIPNDTDTPAESSPEHNSIHPLQSYQPEELSIAGSFPRDFHYGDAENNVQLEQSHPLPKILLMGHTRSGKSSIVEVVFHKMNSTETLYLESNNEIKKERIRNSPFIQLEIWDVYGKLYCGCSFMENYPFWSSAKVCQLTLSTGGIDLKDEKNAAVFEDCDGIVFVIDAQNELAEVKEAVNTMLFAVEKAHR